MTREEAIAELSVLHERLSNPKDCEDGCYSWEDGLYVEAIDMAIEALSEPKGDLISRADAIEAVMAEGRKVYTSEYANAERIIYEADAVEALAMLPSADAVQGEWIWRTDIPIGDGRTSAGYICSNCGKDYWHGNVLDVCPNCGARMTPYKGGDTK